MQTINLDISNKGVLPTVYAKQGDVGRKFEAVLTDGGLPYVPPAGAVFSLWYSGASGEGNYTDISDRTAFSLDGNRVTVELIAQMLTVHGTGTLCLVLSQANGDQMGLWNISYVCEEVPGSDSEEAKNSYSAFSKAVQELPYPDATLSLAGKAADAAATGAAIKAAGSHNLLDNSDFTNPVNQRGQRVYSGFGYTVDRWIAETSAVTVEVNDGYLTINKGTGYGGIFQNLEQYDRLKGQKATIAVNINGTVYVQCFTIGYNSGGASLGDTITFFSIDGANILFRHADNASSNIYWAALYLGHYAAEILPEYRPKGYAAEFMECQRYAMEFGYINAHLYSANTYSHEVHFPVKMRLDAPSVVVRSALGAVGCISSWDGSQWVDYTANIDNINARGCTVKAFGIPANSALGYTLSANADL